jgi:hypothetical protein
VRSAIVSLLLVEWSRRSVTILQEPERRRCKFGCRASENKWRGVEWVVVGSSVAAAGSAFADRALKKVWSILVANQLDKSGKYGGTWLPSQDR